MPGISAMTTTAGPEPATCTILVTSPSVISRRAKSSRGSSLLRLRFVICLAGFQRLTAGRECHGERESEDQSTHPSLAQESRFRQECRSCSGRASVHDKRVCWCQLAQYVDDELSHQLAEQ